MERAKKMLQLCAEGPPPKLGIEYAIIDVLELNSLHLLPKRELKIAADVNLWRVTLPNQKTYHALIVFTGEKAAMEKLLRELIRHRALHNQYKYLATSTLSTQTEPEPMERSAEITTPPMAPHFMEPSEEPVGVAMGSMDINEPNGKISPLLPIFLKAIKNQDDMVHMETTPPRDLEVEPITTSSGPLVKPTTENVAGPSSNQDDMVYMEITPIRDEEVEPITTSSGPLVEPTTENVAGPSSNQGGIHKDLVSEMDAVSQKSRQKSKFQKKKKHCCKYCMKLVGNFSRHLVNMHNLEVEVQTYKNCQSLSEKATRIRNIMAEGDALYNEKHPNSPIVRRLSSKGLGSRTKCPQCKLFISNKTIVHHLRQCRIGAKYFSGSALRVQINRDKFLVHETLNADMKTRIIPFMRNDSIKKLCENDKSLVLYGNKMCERLKGEKQDKTIRNHLRILSRVAERTMQESCGTITSTAEIFQPKHYDKFVNAIYKICGYGETEGEEMAKPTTPHQYGPKMRDLSDTILSELLKRQIEDDADLKKQIKNIEEWQKIYDREFDKQIASLGRKQADRRTYERRQLTPSMDDVQKLLKLIEEKLTSSLTKLKESFNFEDYKTLSKCLLLKLWIFNRRRVGEVDDMILENWQSKKDIDESSDQFKALAKTEQSYASSFKRVVVMSKLRRPAALLVAKRDLESFDTMISLRDQAQIPKENIYLFAINDRYIEGTATMTEFAKECGATNYKLLTGTRLRKQLAASLRYLNLTDEDMRLVAESMGHTEKTHLTKYRTHDPALHAGRMGKILMAIDDGTISQYAGKTIDEIDDSVVSEDLSEDKNEKPVQLTVTDQPSTSTLTQLEDRDKEKERTPVKKLPKEKLSDSDTDQEEPEEKRGNTPGRKRAFARRKPHKKIKISKNLKEALKTQLEEEITEKKCPSTTRVLQAMEALEERFPEIINSSPKKIKVLVSNWSRQK